MRKYLMSLVGAFLFSAVLVVSCSQGDDEFDIYACTDNSLAGTIRLSSFVKGYELWCNDEIVVSDEMIDAGFDRIHTKKLSDSTLALYIMLYRKTVDEVDGRLTIGVSCVELKGEPYDVTFDCVSNDCYVRHADWETYTAQLHVCGWIKNITRYPNLCDQEGESAVIVSDLYTIDMTISGEIDGEEIVFKVDSVTSSF